VQRESRCVRPRGALACGRSRPPSDVATMNQPKRRIDRSVLVATSISIASLLATASCSDKRHDCSWLANCATAGGGGAENTADPCEGRCAGTVTPLCRTTSSSAVCVECRTKDDCTSTKPLCDSTGTCRQCLASSDCKTAEASRCDPLTNSCVACQGDTDCSQITGKTVCALASTVQPRLAGQAGQAGSAGRAAQAGQANQANLANRCVKCTGENAAACGSVNGKSLVCDSLKHECTTYAAESSGLCQLCVSDAHCKPGQLCYLQTFNGAPVGYFCFNKQGDTANATPTDCTATSNRPYIKVQTDAVSIDNERYPLCVLRASTCRALSHYSTVDCGTSTGPSDAICGFSPSMDSKCAAYGTAGSYRCTTSCMSNDDCMTGATCDTGTNPRMCTL
jgi:hypothetical protein